MAFKVNALGARNLAIACENIGAKVVKRIKKEVYLKSNLG